nr:TRAP transporter small permease [uncultured Oscillibacter sp.]
MKKILLWLDEHIEELIGAILLGIVTILISVGVFFRYVLNNSLSWSDELARYCFIWAVFVGMGLAVKNDGNMKINILEMAFPKIAPALCVIQDLIYFVFLVYLIRPTIEVLAKFTTNPQPSPAMQIPMQFVYASFMAGIGFAIFRLAEKYFRKIRAYLLHRKELKEGME